MKLKISKSISWLNSAGVFLLALGSHILHADETGPASPYLVDEHPLEFCDHGLAVSGYSNPISFSALSAIAFDDQSSVFLNDAASLEAAIDDLALHIAGDDVLTEAGLYTLRDTIESDAGTLNGSVALIEKAYNTIQSYEDAKGALFTPGGTQLFNLADSTTDGHALERAMHSLYLAVFDVISSDLIASNRDLVEGLSFGSADYFPGSVPVPDDPGAVVQVQINASVPKDWGRPNLYSELPARRPTGTYLAPGAIADVTVPPALVNSGYQIRVGAHSWDLSNRPSQRRLARATKLYPITSAVTSVANPLGGSIYIEVPHLADDGMVSIQVQNAIRSPYFSARDFDQITVAEWEGAERVQPGAWTDIETDKVMMSVPSKWIRDMSHADITEILNEYDAHMDYVSDYMGKPRIRNKPILFMQVDVIFRGSAFFPGYPMGNYPSFNSETPQAPLVLGHAFDQTMLHEHGHATLMTKFTTNERESLVHMLYPYVATQLYGLPLEESFSNSLAYAKSTDRTMDDVFVSWALRDGFINDIDMTYPNAAYKHRGHADHIQYVDLFGWNALTEFNRKLNVDYVEEGYFFPQNSHENNDRLLRLSREAGADVRPLFHLWGHSATNQATLQAALDAEGLGRSAAIYDLMVAFKSTIPFTQADYNAWYQRMAPVLFSGHRTDFWDPLEASYDTGRAQDAVDRIDALLAFYFPQGRPDDSPVTVYTEAGYSGVSWSLGDGVFGIDSVRASATGNDSISSIRVSPGYEVTVCQHGGNQNNFGLCETYNESVPQLGTLNNQVSYIQVVEIPQATVIDSFPKDRQLYPRNPNTNQASVTVTGLLGNDDSQVTLNVYRQGELWNSWSHDSAQSSAFEFSVDIPAELVNYDFELTSQSASNDQTILATSTDIVAGDVFVINGQSNAASGIYSVSDSSTEDANEFVRSYGGWGTDDWVDNDEWHIVDAECRPLSQFTACVGRLGLRFASDIVNSAQVPVAVINQARGGASIDYFERNSNDANDLATNYGRLLTRLENGGLADQIRGFLWYQGESDRTDIQGHIDRFSALFADWQQQYPTVEQYYVFQIRHTCVPSDAEFGQGSQISNFQREFANARADVTAVSTTALDAHDGCHFAYVNGYQAMGDNVARIVRSELYGEALNDADAADIVSAIRLDSSTIELAFTADNTMVADDGFEALFELRGNGDAVYTIVDGSVQDGTAVRLSVDPAIDEGAELHLSYLSLSGDQNWLTNAAGIGILSFLDFPVTTSAIVEPVPPVTPGTDTDTDGVPDAIEVAEGTDSADPTSFLDTDGDGTADYRDADSNGDGIWNVFEAGAYPYYDRDKDGVPAYLDDDDYNSAIGDVDSAVQPIFDPDADGVANFQSEEFDSVDTDDDGVPDNVEIADGTDAADSSSFLDFDNDEMPDYLDVDDDNDGIADVIEGGGDVDQDGIANRFDTDSDGDGVEDSIEGISDVNGDGVPNFLDDSTTSVIADLDQDNDGIADAVEGTGDADADGIADYLDTDSDNDQLTDLEEGNADIDGDGVPNYLDDDSDGDTISDLIEGLTDVDGDTVGNAFDHDSDGDSIPDAVELTADVDADGLANFVDTDSDGDGIADLLETASDSDDDGVADYLDKDAEPELVVGLSGAGSVGLSGDQMDPLFVVLTFVSCAVLWRRRRLLRES